MRRHHVSGNDDFLERIINFSEWSNLLRALCFIRQCVSRLNIVSGRTKITNKVNFQLLTCYFPVPIFFSDRYDSYVYAVTTHTQFIVDHIFHGVGLFKLTKVNSCIPKSKVRKIIFFWGFNVSPIRCFSSFCNRLVTSLLIRCLNSIFVLSHP